MMQPPIARLIDAIRESHPDMTILFLQGQCYNLFRIVRTVFPDAECMYSMIEGHVYIRHDGKIYDIRGCHFRPPADLRPMEYMRGDKPHRWGARDTRRLIDTAKIIVLPDAT